MKALKWCVIPWLTFWLAACGSDKARIASSKAADLCVPQNLTCQRDPGISKLKVKGSCTTDDDCNSALGPGGAVCTLQDPADPTSYVCIKSCSDNSSCPFGSYCNDSGDCYYDCDGSANSCPQGQTCNCNGQCAPTCQTPPQTQAKPTLSLSTTALTMVLPSSAATAATTAQFTVSVSVPTQDMVATAQTMPVTITPDAGVTVACNQTGTSTFQSKCTLSNWSFSNQGSSWVATQTVTVRLVPWASQLPSSMFLITVAGNGMVNPLQLVAITGQVTSSNPAQLGDGQYVGSVVIQSDPTGPSVTDTIIPVTATLRANTLAIQDPSRALSASGAVFVGQNGYQYPEIWVGAGTPTAGTSGMMGLLDVTIQSVSLTQQVSAGVITGQYDVVDHNQQHLVHRLRLTPTTALKSCMPSASNNSCPLGTACDTATSLCLPSRPAFNPPITHGGFQNSAATSWDVSEYYMLGGQGVTLAGNVTIPPAPPIQNVGYQGGSGYRYVVGDIFGAYDYWGTPMATPQIQDNEMLSVGNALNVVDIGKNACIRDIGDFKRTIPGEVANEFRYWQLVGVPGGTKNDVYGCPVFGIPGDNWDTVNGTGWYNYHASIGGTDNILTARTNNICSDLYISLNGQYQSTNNCTPPPDAQRLPPRRKRVPCLVADGLTVKPWWAWWNKSPQFMTCYDLEQKAVANGNVPAAMLFDTWRKNNCEPTGGRFEIEDITGQFLSDVGATNGWYVFGNNLSSWDVYECDTEDIYFGTKSARLTAERIACYDPKLVGDDTALLETTHFGNQVLTNSGDLSCQRNMRENPCSEQKNPGCTAALINGGAMPQTFPFYTMRDANPNGIIADDTVYQNCMNELALTPAGIVASTPNGSSDGAALLKALFAERQCISLARFYPSLFTSDGHRYSLRLLQQWLGLQRFIAGQASLRAIGERVSDQNDYARDLSVPLGLDTPQTINGNPIPAPLDELDRGMELFLDYRVNYMLEHVPGATLADADYRKDDGVNDGTAGREQLEGLPVSMLRGLVAYYEALGFHADRVNTATYDACPGNDPGNYRATAIQRVTGGIRIAELVALLAEDLHARAVASGATISWADAWTKARNQYWSARAKLQGRLAELTTCVNPLAINDADTPIFFEKGSADNLPQMFTSADFFVTRAKNEIANTFMQLTAARNAWTNRNNSIYGQETFDGDKKRRIENIKEKYGSTLLDLCGEPPGVNTSSVEFDQFSADPNNPSRAVLKPETCFYKAEVATCQPSMLTSQCLRGQLGEAAIAIGAAQQEVAIATQQWHDAELRYDVQGRYCATMTQDEQGLKGLLYYHELEMADLNEALGTAQTEVELQKAAIGVVESGITGNFLGAYAGEAQMMVAGTTEVTVHDISAAIAAADLKHQDELEMFKMDEQIKGCWNEQAQYGIAIKTAQMTITTKALEFEQAVVHFNNLLVQARNAAATGLDEVAKENAWSVPPPANEYWVTELEDLYTYQLRKAQRLTYLAVNAVLYETQASISGLGPLQRRNVLAATHPQHLQKVLDDITNIWDDNKRGQWNPDYLVIDLKDIIDDRSRQPQANGRNQDSTQRLRDLLWAPENAIYDDYGNYVGQGLPFSLSRETVGRGQGTSLKATCGERLWAVSSLIKLDTSWDQVVQVELRKRNTFYSQYCNNNPDSSHFQVASILPDANPLEGTGEDTGGADRFTPASFKASLTADYSSLFATANNYTLPMNTRFADRGLYGDYILLFRYDAGPLSGNNAFPLGSVDDIYLRFDFIRKVNSSSGLTNIPPVPDPSSTVP